jgi:hypothetical protein
MCKLYAVQTTMTRDWALKLIAEKAKAILKTESHGIGFALNVNGRTRRWQCGESMTDAVGEDVTAGLDDTLQVATLIMHGRTSTSSDRSVNHSHPRPTKYGPLIHNGVVFPKKDTKWKMEYALDTDYLGELASRDELHLAADYLGGYAGVMLLKDDGTLIVQNQGANLYLKLEDDTIEFGTTQILCPGGNKFEHMRAEMKEFFFSSEPIPIMGGRDTKYDAITNIGVETKKDEPEKKLQHPASACKSGTEKPKAGRTRDEIGPNPRKKGKKKTHQEPLDRDFIGEEELIPEFMRDEFDYAMGPDATEEERAAAFDFIEDSKRA